MAIRKHEAMGIVDEVLTIRREFMLGGTAADLFWSGDGIRAISFVAGAVGRVMSLVGAYQRCQLGT